MLDARQIVANAIEQVRPLIDARRHRLTLRTSPELAYIEGDHKRLVQILSNVLNNAAKYTPEGGEIVLSMDVKKTELVYTVSDNRIGIAAGVIDHIFDLFAQAERTSDRTQGGPGIGLALVKNLVQLHNGTVTARSDGPATGSQFQLTFPRCAHVENAPSKPVADSATWLTPLRILVVDDNVDAAMMLGMFLQLAGHQVEVVQSAAAALESAAQADRIDACLLDIGLPDMDGNDLAARLRAIPATATTMLIAITGYGQDSDRRKTRESGFDHHYVKPVDMEKLVRTLAALHHP